MKSGKSLSEKGPAESRPPPTRALVVGPYRNERRSGEPPGFGFDLVQLHRSFEARVAEAQGLAEAIDLDVVESKIVTLPQIRPATYIGPGKVDEIAAIVKQDEIALVVFDCALSPVQQRNLEKGFQCKVIDRTGLILEIFGQRARTKEGTLQVELAHLAYQKSRLVRSWTHLERQRGGFGFLGGPGETQIETDRRLIQERMTRIERDLANVKKTRGLHRKKRRAVPYPVVALVGYTNAGKSTLFNRLTKAGVMAEDMLFATLDPTLRAVRLPRGSNIILSDTVGFISDLPTMLVEAFKATLEEVIEADIILHVRDMAHADSEAQRADVEAVLAGLGIVASAHKPMIEVWNKLDLLDSDQSLALFNAAQRRPAKERPVLISALTGQGVDDLLAGVEASLAHERVTLDLRIEAADGQGRNWLYEHTEVLQRCEAEDGMTHFTVRVAPALVDTLRRKFVEIPPVAPLRQAPY
ncbi:GTPase HflX [Methylovirgula sp. HY1]|uniref:GTPase HflX n=1 Tax=Methylovirgula sp. HY1 TaxID=2822761 RepID=UPI00351D4C4B